MEFSHLSVMLPEVIAALEPERGGVYVDCTAGGGGHSLEIAKRLPEGSRLICLDQDDDAVINIDTLGTDASIGIYVADSVENTRGVPGARFAEKNALRIPKANLTRRNWRGSSTRRRAKCGRFSPFFYSRACG